MRHAAPLHAGRHLRRSCLCCCLCERCGGVVRGAVMCCPTCGTRFTWKSESVAAGLLCCKESFQGLLNGCNLPLSHVKGRALTFNAAKQVLESHRRTAPHSRRRSRSSQEEAWLHNFFTTALFSSSCTICPADPFCPAAQQLCLCAESGYHLPSSASCCSAVFAQPC